MERRVAQEPGHGKSQDRDQRGHFVGKVGRIWGQTQDLHSWCNCRIPREPPHSRNTGVCRCLKHLAYKERYNVVITSIRTI